MAPTLAVVIPVFNRPQLLRYSLASVRAAAREVSIEVIVVDDGSTDRPDAVVSEFPTLPIRLLRQPNSGSIPARVNGLRVSTARYVQFLDSDDLVAPEKFKRQLAELDRTGVDVVYSDAASVTLDGSQQELHPIPCPAYRTAVSLAEFSFRVQPNPHAPIYRRKLIEAGLNSPVVSPARHYDPVGDAWIYYNICTLSGKVLHTPGPWAIIGRHPGVRYSRHWEELGVAAWHMMVEFHQRCPRTLETVEARQLFGEACFAMWRGLPRDFDANIEETLITMWRYSPASSATQMGGKWFSAIASTIGVLRTARIFRRLQRPLYREIATLPTTKFRMLLHGGRPPR